MDLTVELRAILNGLAAATGAEPADLETDHGRWRLYLRAIELGVGRDLLFRTVRADAEVGPSLVVRMLEEVPDTEREAWVSQLPDHNAFVRRRMEELRIFESLATPGRPSDVAAELAGWSDWLQRQVASFVADKAVLAIVAEHGRTRRIRGMAAQRLRKRPRR